MIVSDPFTSVTRFNSETLKPPFKEWFNTEYSPVALQAGLHDRESCKRMRSHLDYAAKQAYDIATEIHGFLSIRYAIICIHKFKSSERLTMAALHARRMGSTESATAYALQLETMYKIIRPTPVITNVIVTWHRSFAMVYQKACWMSVICFRIQKHCRKHSSK